MPSCNDCIKHVLTENNCLFSLTRWKVLARKKGETIPYSLRIEVRQQDLNGGNCEGTQQLHR
jgi:hypothetical protein